MKSIDKKSATLGVESSTSPENQLRAYKKLNTNLKKFISVTLVYATHKKIAGICV